MIAERILGLAITRAVLASFGESLSSFPRGIRLASLVMWYCEGVQRQEIIQTSCLSHFNSQFELWEASDKVSGKKET